jgi:hypothetical protein
MVHKRGDLFGNQTHHEHHDGNREQERAHIRKTIRRKIGVKVMTKTSQEQQCAGGRKYLQGRIQRPNLKDYQQKSDAIA